MKQNADPPTLPLFQELALWLDDSRQNGARHMAVDHYLFESMTPADLPILRVYQWQGPAISIGCHEPWRHTDSTSNTHVEYVRRSSGGGRVTHGKDWTYTLLAPLVNSLSPARFGEIIYQAVHQALARTLKKLGHPHVHIAPDGTAQRGGSCFENPVRWDLLDKERKIAGAGQRRNRVAILQQGSVQLNGINPQLGQALAASLARNVHHQQPPLNNSEINRLVAERFGNPLWTRRL